MSTTNSQIKTWRAAQTLTQAENLIDVGVMLRWSEMAHLKKAFSEDDQKKLVAHFAKRLSERADQRLSAEIVVESLLVWLSFCQSETLLSAFLLQLFQESSCEKACHTLVEIALGGEYSDGDHFNEVFGMSVVLVCELGLAIREFEKAYPGEFRGVAAALDHVETYLLSVSNSSSSTVRLSLLHYFGHAEKGLAQKKSFNKVMNRFGHTVLEHVFAQLFNKKTEAVALEYLLDNLGFVLEASSETQHIVHEIFKFHMLKEPERFALFLQTFSDHLAEQSHSSLATQTYLQHMSALLNVVSEVGHKPLAQEIMLSLVKFSRDGVQNKLVEGILRDTAVRVQFRQLLGELQQSALAGEWKEIQDRLRTSKRGRKPRFARATGLGTLNQVAALGGSNAA